MDTAWIVTFLDGTWTEYFGTFQRVAEHIVSNNLQIKSIRLKHA